MFVTGLSYFSCSTLCHCFNHWSVCLCVSTIHISYNISYHINIHLITCLCLQWACASICDPKSCHILGIIVSYTTLHNSIVWFTVCSRFIMKYFSQPCVSCNLSCAGLLWRTKVSSVISSYYNHFAIFLIMENVPLFLGDVIRGI